MHTENVLIIYHHVIEPIITYAAGVWGHVAEKKYAKKLLASVQRGFAIKAIRAFRTVSTSAALALAQFIPLDLRVREVYCVERARLLGTTHLLPDDIRLELPTPIHELLHPADRVTIPLATSKNQEEVNQAIRNNTTHNTVHIYTDGSKQDDGRVGAAFVCFDPGGTGTTPTIRKLKLHNCCTVFQAELLAILHACRWALAHKYHQVMIFTDSLSSIMAIQDRSNTHPLVSQIHRVLWDYREVGNLGLSWVKSHVGVVGNEMADRAANSACSLHRQPDYSNFPISYIKGLLRKSSLDVWQSRYASAEQGKHTRTLLPSLGDIRKLWKATTPSFYLTQALTGHGYHRAYLRRFHLAENDHCPCDDATTQSLAHLFEKCPRFERARFPHEMVCRHLGVSPYALPELLAEGKGKALEGYLALVDSILSEVKDFNRDTTETPAGPGNGNGTSQN